MSKFYKFKNQTGDSRDLYIYGDIVPEKRVSWSTGKVSETDVDLQLFRENVNDLVSGQTLNMYINSGGGSVFAASTMVSMLRRAKERGVKVVAYVDGLAGSAASLFPMVASETHIYENSMIMIHKPIVDPYSCGSMNADELMKLADELNSVEDGVLLPLYKDNTELSTEDIKALLRAETWLNRKEIPEYFKNFIIHGEAKAVAACVSNFFKIYQHTPAFYNSTHCSEKAVIDYSEYEHKLNLIKKGEN